MSTTIDIQAGNPATIDVEFNDQSIQIEAQPNIIEVGAPTGAQSGEANTASNVGAGVGTFKQKAGANLEMRSVVSLDPGLTVTLSGDGNEIELDLSGAADNEVAVSAADTTPAFLDTKITAGGNLDAAILNPGANESLELSLNTDPILLADGSAAAPAFGFDAFPGVGIYSPTGGIAFAIGGAARWVININGDLVGQSGTMIFLSDGTPGNPAYTFNSDPDTGIRRVSADVMALMTAGVDQWQIDASGNLVDPTGANLVDGVDVSAHAARHENGGADEISVAGLSGLLADPQTPLGHAATHADGGSDELNAASLGSGAAGAGQVLTADGVGGNAYQTIVTTDELVGASGTDTTPGFLQDKLAAGLAITITLLNGGGDEDVQLAVNEGAITHQNLGGAGTNDHAAIDAHIGDASIHFTEASIDHTAILNVGTNTHAQIDSHIASTANPHSVTLQQAFDAGPVIASTTVALGIPVMTTAQRTALADSAGLIVYDSDIGQLHQNTGAGWTIPGAGLTTLQGAYDNDPTGAQILLNATPNPITIQAQVSGDVFSAIDVGGNGILTVTADPDTVLIEAGTTIEDAFLNAGSAASLILQDTFTTGGGFVGGGVQSLGTVTYNNSVFIWALLQESKRYQAAAGPGFAAFTLFNAIPTIANQGNFNLVQALILNCGVAHERTSFGTSTVTQTVGVSFAPQTRALVSGAVMRKTTGDVAVNVAPTYSTVAGSTADLGTTIGLRCFQPAQALFQPGAGIETFDAYYGIDFQAMTHVTGGDKVVVRSAMTDAVDRFFLQNNGGARSDFGGGLLLDCSNVQILGDNLGLFLGATSGDVVINWNGSALEYDFLSGDDLRWSAGTNNHTLQSANFGTASELRMGFDRFAFGQTGAVGNQVGVFVAPARTMGVAGEWSDFLLTQAANLTVPFANSNVFGWTINAPSITLSGPGSVTTGAALNVGGNISTGVNRVGVRILSNPSGGAGVNAALWVTAGRTRLDGVLDVNNGVALGGGAGATLGTIGGSGPTAAAQAQWLEIEINGVSHWIPVWT